MFVHDSRLCHLLTPAQYHDERQHQLEVERLFLLAWHVVASTADLSRPGDFLTLDLLGQPLLVRNVDGEVCAYQNVCAHRHCLLTHLARGFDPRFRCQYHGWEYDKDGRTARIPDARCFRPFDRENAHLRRYRSETCGELVFVSLSEDGPSLAEFLGPYYDVCRAGFAAPYRLKWTWETVHQANWKVPIENSLESYHVPCLHAKTFGEFPTEEMCEHDLKDNYTTFRTPEPDKLATQMQRWFVRRLGRSPTSIYTQHHTHPHITWASLDIFHLVQMILPASPKTCRHMTWLYTLRGIRRNPWTWMLGGMLAWLVKLITRQILLEDVAVYPDIQRGLNVSTHPGVIGTREERVFAFQEYVVKACSEGTEKDKKRELPLSNGPYQPEAQARA